MKITIVNICILLSLNLSAQIGAFRITSGSAIQLGYSNYRYLSFGISPTTPNNGAWAIEHWDGGLNFWKPWPSSNSGNYKMFLSDDGFVGINMKPNPRATSNSNAMSKWCPTAGNMRLQVSGNVISHGYFHWSDSLLKTNVQQLENCTEKLMALRPKKYNYKLDIPVGASTGDTNSIDEKQFTATADTQSEEPHHYGLYAQEVKRQFPLLVSSIGNYEAVNYSEFVTILIKGFQEQQATIDSQRLEIANLRQEIINWQGRSIDTIGQSRSRLFQNTPNPFDGTTTITYFIDESVSVSSATIEVRNIMGTLQSTITLSDGTGLGSVEYNGGMLNPGYYIYTLKINGSVKDSKMFLKEN